MLNRLLAAIIILLGVWALAPTAQAADPAAGESERSEDLAQAGAWQATKRLPLLLRGTPMASGVPMDITFTGFARAVSLQASAGQEMAAWHASAW